MNKILLALSIPLLLASCITDGTNSSSDSIYYKSQAAADEALEVFDTANPSCQLWTNWQKMCSRTGPNGETWCTIDPDRPVRPSTPFCAGDSDGQGFVLDPLAKPKQMQSASRYCEKIGVSVGGRSYCARPKLHRPFNGYRLAARRHPSCDVWSGGDIHNPVCTETDEFPNIKKCSLLANEGFESKEPLRCSKRSSKHSVTSYCAKIQGWGAGPDFPPPEPYIITNIPIRNTGPYIDGIMCQIHNEDK